MGLVVKVNLEVVFSDSSQMMQLLN